MGDRGDRPLALAHLGDQQHVRAVAVDLEPLGRLVEEDRGRERAEALPELDLHVEGVAHLRVARVGEDAARAEGPGPELHPALEPADHVALRDELRGAGGKLLVGEGLVPGPGAVEVLRDLGVGELRAEVGVRPRLRPRLLVEGVVDVVGDADRAARVAGRGLHPELLHRRLADDPAVRHAVEGDARRPCTAS